MKTNRMTPKQRSYISHLYETRQAPEMIADGSTPGTPEWSAARDIATGRLYCTSRQASNLIDWLLTRPISSDPDRAKYA